MNKKQITQMFLMQLFAGLLILFYLSSMLDAERRNNKVAFKEGGIEQYTIIAKEVDIPEHIRPPFIDKDETLNLGAGLTLMFCLIPGIMLYIGSVFHVFDCLDDAERMRKLRKIGAP